MSKNTGKDFELLTFELYSGFTAKDPSISVEHDVQLAGPDGPRQIDILIRSTVAGHDLLTIIECRDYKKALDVTAVDGLHSKLMDVGASKGVLVARQGFSSTARQKAKRLNIDLMLVAQGAEELKRLATRIPVVVVELTVSVDPTISIQVRGGPFTLYIDKFEKDWGVFGGQMAIKAFQQDLLSGRAPLPYSGELEWRLEPEETYSITSVSGAEGKLGYVLYKYRMYDTQYYIGNLDQLDSAKIIASELGANTMALVDINDLYDQYKTFEIFSTEDSIPIKGWKKYRLPALSLRSDAVPKIIFDEWIK